MPIPSPASRDGISKPSVSTLGSGRAHLCSTLPKACAESKTKRTRGTAPEPEVPSPLRVPPLHPILAPAGYFSFFHRTISLALTLPVRYNGLVRARLLCLCPARAQFADKLAP